MINRAADPGWERIGVQTGRRSLWVRYNHHRDDSLELCAGREGDDAYIRIARDFPGWEDMRRILQAASHAVDVEIERHIPIPTIPSP